jgi:uncharacterized protein YllA (UPF0747 family)
MNFKKLIWIAIALTGCENQDNGVTDSPANFEQLMTTEQYKSIADTDENLLSLDIHYRDDTDLKKLFVPIAKEDLLHEVSSTEVEKQSEKLSEHYKLQVNPREINLFYLTDDSRKRIVKQKDKYFIHDTELHFSEEELMDELHEHPERFSPNVILRPVYQEAVLPNLAYTGGPAEVAYWMQLKPVF